MDVIKLMAPEGGGGGKGVGVWGVGALPYLGVGPTGDVPLDRVPF